MKIVITADGQTVKMRKRTWSMTCPAADLPRWIAFYTKLAAGKFGTFYREDLADLIKAQERINQRKAA